MLCFYLWVGAYSPKSDGPEKQPLVTFTFCYGHAYPSETEACYVAKPVN